MSSSAWRVSGRHPATLISQRSPFGKILISKGWKFCWIVFYEAAKETESNNHIGAIRKNHVDGLSSGHHTSHFFTGFIGEPRGQLQSWSRLNGCEICLNASMNWINIQNPRLCLKAAWSGCLFCVSLPHWIFACWRVVHWSWTLLVRVGRSTPGRRVSIPIHFFTWFLRAASLLTLHQFLAYETQKSCRGE